MPRNWPPSQQKNRENKHTSRQPHLMSWAFVSAQLMTWEVLTAASIGVILVCAYCRFNNSLHPAGIFRLALAVPSTCMDKRIGTQVAVWLSPRLQNAQPLGGTGLCSRACCILPPQCAAPITQCTEHEHWSCRTGTSKERLQVLSRERVLARPTRTHVVLWRNARHVDRFAP
jgi:hypothetical protein